MSMANGPDMLGDNVFSFPHIEPACPTSAYHIYRQDQSTDPTAPLIFYPAKDSDDLFFALKAAFPAFPTHSERMREAVIHFLMTERHLPPSVPQAQQPPVAITSYPCTTATSPQSSWVTASSSAVSSTASPDMIDSAFATWSLSAASSTGQDSSMSIGRHSRLKSPRQSTLEQMTGVFSLASRDVKTSARTRRKMTDLERKDYRKRRQVRACDTCSKRKRKCVHDPASQTSISKSISKGTEAWISRADEALDTSISHDQGRDGATSEAHMLSDLETDNMTTLVEPATTSDPFATAQLYHDVPFPWTQSCDWVLLDSPTTRPRDSFESSMPLFDDLVDLSPLYDTHFTERGSPMMSQSGPRTSMPTSIDQILQGLDYDQSSHHVQLDSGQITTSRPPGSVQLGHLPWHEVPGLQDETLTQQSSLAPGGGKHLSPAEFCGTGLQMQTADTSGRGLLAITQDRRTLVTGTDAHMGSSSSKVGEQCALARSASERSAQLVHGDHQSERSVENDHGQDSVDSNVPTASRASKLTMSRSSSLVVTTNRPPSHRHPGPVVLERDSASTAEVVATGMVASQSGQKSGDETACSPILRCLLTSAVKERDQLDSIGRSQSMSVSYEKRNHSALEPHGKLLDPPSTVECDKRCRPISMLVQQSSFAREKQAIGVEARGTMLLPSLVTLSCALTRVALWAASRVYTSQEPVTDTTKGRATSTIAGQRSFGPESTDTRWDAPILLSACA